MPTRLDTNFARLTDPDEFESMVRDICAREWGDPNTAKYGRSGQKQTGVDVYGQPEGLDGVYRGAQCKLRTTNAPLTEVQIEKEVTEARHFPHKLDTLILVTDAPRDKDTQILVDTMRRHIHWHGDDSPDKMFPTIVGLVQFEQILPQVLPAFSFPTIWTLKERHDVLFGSFQNRLQSGFAGFHRRSPYYLVRILPVIR